MDKSLLKKVGEFGDQVYDMFDNGMEPEQIIEDLEIEEDETLRTMVYSVWAKWRMDN